MIGQDKSRIRLQDNQSNTFFEHIPKGLSEDSLMAFILKNRRRIEAKMPDKFADSFFDNMNADNRKIYNIDSIPEIAYLFINGIEFQNKMVLAKINNFRITNINVNFSELEYKK